MVDDEPLLFHTGPRGLFPVVRDAVARVLPVERLRWIGFSHFEADECGALNDLLAAAPHAAPLCGRGGDGLDRRPGRPAAPGAGRRRDAGARTGPRDLVRRPARAPRLGLRLPLRGHTRTLLCGDLFTQGGGGHPALTEADILGPSEACRKPMDYYSHAPDTAGTSSAWPRLAPTTLACMHGSAWRGDGAALLRALADAIEG